MSSRTSPRRVLAQQRREKAVELRIERRWPLSRIAEELGISKQAVHKAINVALDTSIKETASKVDRMRVEETMALDRMQAAIWDQAVSEVSLLMPADEDLPKNGKGNVDMQALVAMIQTGTDNRLKAINEILKISKRRAALHGLDMPVRSILEGSFQIEGQVNVRHELMSRFDQIRERRLAAAEVAIPSPEPEPAVIEVEAS